MVAALISRFNAFYAHSYEAHPLRTLILANGTLQSTGDLIAQGVNAAISYKQHGRCDSWDAARTARFAAFGFAMGPFVGKWLIGLDRVFPLPKTGSAVPAVVKRVLADQLVFAPAGLATFLTFMGLAERKSMPEIKTKFDDVYMMALKANWSVWPLFQAVNFSIIPLPYRLPAQQGAGILWTVFLSMVNARQDVKAELDATLHANDELPKA
ncbi:hypothetical protein CspeluHIS016_0703550 [Cutaneotrichosporon spelunceum]|uniref:Protein SYM1 n=1 Tax=Cutaneotrichosporon spelunceum TaxID=1672016 RepID=A0AAD3TYQ4_9TREE|nr:hypothetical protein CspeluHIS016_0703550 [Cutaneotrichosporon spelunceum]